MFHSMFHNLLKKKLYLFITIFILLIVGISLGSAILTKTLSIGGKTKIHNNWIIYFDNIVLNSNSVTNEDTIKDAKIVDYEKQNIEFSTNLSSVSDFYEFDVYTVNDGNVDAMIDSIELTGLDGNEGYINYDVNYDDASLTSSDDYYSNKYTYSDDKLKPCDPLYGGTRRKIKVRVSLKKELEDDEPISLDLGFKINYVQLDDSCASKHILTIDPNGGVYSNSASLTKINLVSGNEYQVLVPINGDQEFLGWEVTPSSGTYTFDSTQTTTQQFIMGDEDVTIRAKWSTEGDFVARIMNTYYSTIQKAFDDVDRGWANNTVYLLKDTTEYPTNNANNRFIFDLGAHTITGNITNSKNSNITLTNGKVIADTTDDVAFYNHGILSLSDGDNDSVQVENSISLKGNKYGLYGYKDSEFNFYDGYIEAISSNGSSITGGNLITPEGYSVVIDSLESGERAYLTRNPNRKVAKKITGGTIFYENLQLAFNAAVNAKNNLYEEQKQIAIEEAQTHGNEFDETEFKNNFIQNFEELTGSTYENYYKIYAIRDFNAPNAINISNNSDIYFDLTGFNVQFGDEIINDGSLYVLNSKSYINAEDRSKIEVSKSITNNGKLDISDVNFDATTDVNLIVNNSNLVIKKAIINSKSGYGIYNITNGNVNFDENTIIKSIDSYGMYNESNDTLTINNGIIYSILNNSPLIIKGNAKFISSTKEYSGENISAIVNQSDITIEGGKFIGDVTSPIYNNGNIVYKGGNFESDYTLMYNSLNGKVIIEDGEINAQNLIVYNGILQVDKGILHSVNVTVSDCVAVINGGLIESENSTAINVSNVTINDGKIKAKEYGINAGSGNEIHINGGIIESDNVGIISNYSFYHYFSGSKLYMTDGEIYAKNIGIDNAYIFEMSGGKIVATNLDSDSSTSIGLISRNSFSNVNIISGEIFGDLYGAQINGELTLGIDDSNIISDLPKLRGESYGLYIENDSIVNFYDGILKGITDGYYGNITRLPFRTVIGEDTEIIDENLYQTDFVSNYENWLRVGQQEFNNINDASEYIEDEGTIQVIKNADISFNQEFVNNEAGNKKITFDLNGYSISTTQSITNNVELTIIDSSENNSGSYTSHTNIGLINNKKLIINNGKYYGDSEYIIQNNNEIIVNEATFDVEKNVINNYNFSNLIINNIDIENSKTGIFNKGTIELNNGIINSIDNGIYSDAGAINVEMNGGTINSSRYGIYSIDSPITINNGIIETTSDYAIYNHYSSITINDGKITTNNNTAVCSAGSIEVNGGSITGKKGIANTYYEYYGSINWGTITINDGTITGTIYSGVESSAGILNIYGGQIYGESDGVYSKAITTIGKDDDNISITSPLIQGKNYGLNTSSYTNFFDGIMKGKTAAHTGLISLIPEATMIKDDVEVIDGDMYNTQYLTEYGNWIRVGDREFNSINDAASAMNDGDTMVVIANPYINFSQEIPPHRVGTLDLNGHSLIMTSPLVNYGFLTITDSTAPEDNFGGSITNLDNSALVNKGSLTIDKGIYTSEKSMYLSDYVYTIKNEGTLILNNGSIKSTEDYAIYNEGTFTMNNGTIDTLIGIYNDGTFTMNNGYINTTKDVGLLSRGNVTINNGTIKRTMVDNHIESFNAVKIDTGEVNINGGNISSDISGGCALYIDRINGDAPSVYLNDGNIYGRDDGVIVKDYYYYEHDSKNFVMTGGVIGSEQYGLYVFYGNVLLNGGSINSGLYGAYIKNGVLNLGEDDGNISDTSPSILGDSYAIYNNGVFNFSDGIIKGNVNGDTDTYYGDLTKIPERTELLYGNEIIDDKNYTTTKVINEQIKAEIIRNGEHYKDYKNLQDAFNEAIENDTIRILRDFSLFEPLYNNISEEITLDMDGHKIITNRQIINNGNLNIINNSNNDAIIQTRSKIDLLVNNSKLSMNNIKFKYLIESDYNVIVNYDELNLNEVDADSKVRILCNFGMLNINNSDINANISVDRESLYSDTTRKVTINDSTMGSVYLNYGTNDNEDNVLFDDVIFNGIVKINHNVKLKTDNTTINGYMSVEEYSIVNFENSTLNYDYLNWWNEEVAIYNRGTFNMINSKLYMNDDKYIGRYLSGINNYGTLNLNSSEIYVGFYDKTKDNTLSNIGIKSFYNSVSNISNSKVSINGGTNSYGIYLQENSTVNFVSGEINVKNATNGYGVYAYAGSFVMGEDDEIVYSEKDRYEDPKIYVSSSQSAFGIKKINGEVSFYDGIVWSSQHAIPETVTNIATPYEVTTYIDDYSGFEYAVLEDINDDYHGTAVALCNGIYYTKIQDAINRANTGDEIKLLQSTTEDLIINKTKDITINLNGRSITTTIDNKGKLRIYNGLIENIDKTVVNNNGTFIMGSNDGIVSSSSVRISSETTAINNNETFIMYDGYIEGNEPINGQIDVIPSNSRIYTYRDEQKTRKYLQEISDEAKIRGETDLILTIDPNGGVYDGSSDVREVYLKYQTTYTLQEPTKDYAIFDGWESTVEDSLNGNIVTIGLNDIKVTAKWIFTNDVVAIIGEKYYTSLVNAINDSKDGDIIKLIKDTNENIVVNKDITIDLNSKKITGMITNNSTLNLLNGTIENNNGTAIINNGVLILGEDDSTLSADSIKIIGTTKGIEQNGVLKFYDGFIEGENAIDGKVDSLPNNYYLYVELNNGKQKMFLAENPNDSIAAINNNGNILYFTNLIDSINSAISLNKEITIIKNFESEELIDIAQNTNISINLNGHDIIISNNLNNSGNLKIRDASNVGGTISIIKTVVNNGSLDLNNISLRQITDDETILNNGTLKVDNTTVTSKGSATIETTGEIYILNDSNILSESNYGIINNQDTVLTINSGTISSIFNKKELVLNSNVTINNTLNSIPALYMDNDSKITINGGNIKSNGLGVQLNNNCNLIVNDGSITTSNYGVYLPYSIYNSNITINGGTIESTSESGLLTDSRNDSNEINITDGTIIGAKNGIYAGEKFNMTGGEIISNSSSVNDDFALYCNSTCNISGNSIIKADKTSALMINYGQSNISGGYIESKALSGTGIFARTTNISISGNTRVVTSGLYAVGIVLDSYRENATINDIDLVSANIGILIRENDVKLNVYGGTITGNLYGIKQLDNTSSIKIGNEEDEISQTNPYISGGLYGIYIDNKSLISFYSGRLRGKIDGCNKSINIIANNKKVLEEVESNSNYANAKTNSTENVSLNPLENTAKKGNGYAIITYIGNEDTCDVTTPYEYDYKGLEVKFKTPCTGKYKLEVWGAQGGRYDYYEGGYGAYSKGEINLTENEILYINVGGQGSSTTNIANSISLGGYNGGGDAYNSSSDGNIFTSGGGATHIATHSGLLSSLENDRNEILIVAGGGAGFSLSSIEKIGHGGGNIGGSSYSGNNYVKGATQEEGSSFGEAITTNTVNTPGAGGGFYGGYSDYYVASGGSGYIGNSRLSSAYMYSYNAEDTYKEWINNYLVDNDDYLQVGSETFSSMSDAISAITNSGTILVIGDATVQENPIIPNNKEITLNLNNHNLNLTNSITNNGILRIKDLTNNNSYINSINNANIINYGDLFIDDVTIKSKSRGIDILSNNHTIKLNNVTFETDDDSIFDQDYSAYANTINITDCSIISNNGRALLIRSDNRDENNKNNITISNSNLVGKNNAINLLWADLNIEDSELSANSDDYIIYLSNSTTNITNCMVSSDKSNGIFASEAIVNINNSQIILSNEFNYEPYGMVGISSSSNSVVKLDQNSKVNTNGTGLYSYYEGNYIVNDAEIISNKNFGVNINSGNLYLNGGKVIGKRNGIYLTGGNVNIGSQEKELSIESPFVSGDEYAIYKTGGNVNFYNGKIRGITAPINSDFYKLRTASEINESFEFGIPGDMTTKYTVNYLSDKEGFLQVGDNIYNTFEKAVEALGESKSGTITLIKNSLLQEPTELDGTDIIFDLNGYKLTTTQEIVNKGKLTIEDSKNNEGTINNIVSTAIVNSGELIINSGIINAKVHCIQIDSTSGPITINDVDMQSENNCINYNYWYPDNNLVLTINGGNYKSTGANAILLSKYSSSVDDVVNISNAHIVGLDSGVSMSFGVLNISNSYIENTSTNGERYALNIDGISATIDDGTKIYSKYANGIEANNNITNLNDVEINANYNGMQISYSTVNMNGNTKIDSNGDAVILYFDNSRLNMFNGELISNNIGISIVRGTANIYSGTVKGKTYGTYLINNNSNLTIGNIEENNSIKDPSIIGGTYGIYKNAGTVKFYSGILKGTTKAYYNSIDQIRGGYEIYEDYDGIDVSLQKYRTLSTSESSIDPKENTSKLGNGYAKITYTGGNLIKSDYDDETLEEYDCTSILNKPISYGYSGNYKKFVSKCNGTYKVELWGAQGGNGSNASGGKGAYTSGTIHLNNDDELFVYVGGQGTYTAGGYNGGGNPSTDSYGGGGGGATDIRLVKEQIYSRIMVAGAGGGAYYYNGSWYNNGAAAGGLSGQNGEVINSCIPGGGTQTSGGICDSNTNNAGGFGYGGSNLSGLTSGGGSGYYGGSARIDTPGSSSGGGGGSSYISGYIGSVAIKAEGDLTPRNDSNGNQCTETNALNDVKCSYHYSNKIFNETIMYSGTESMPTHDGNSTMTGNTGDGYAKITLVNLDESNTVKVKFITEQGYVEDEEKEYQKNDTLGTLETPIIDNDNIRFVGWYLEPSYVTQVDEDYVITKNIVLYAKFIYYSDTCENVPVGKTYNYDYSGGEQVFTSNCAGVYKLETWGAQGGGSNGGYGSYSKGEIFLASGETLYINVGGQGKKYAGGYNGGGTGGLGEDQWAYGGGGATHIATSSGKLSTLEDNKDSIIIVAGAGGGGGGYNSEAIGGAGGGYKGNNGYDSYVNSNEAYTGTGATQSSGGYAYWCSSDYTGSFGKGSNYCDSGYGGAGGGAGYYGGGGSNRGHGGGGGGSGYIANSRLFNKYMYGYNIVEEYPYEYANIAYLIETRDIVKNSRTNTKYTNFQDAINASENNDTLELIGDINVSYNLDISSNKNITLDLKGYNLQLTKTINNNGTLIINNSNTNIDSMLYSNVVMSLIDNNGTLNIDNVTLKGTTTINNSTGNYTITNSIINGKSYAIYDSSNNESTISNSDITSNSVAIYNYSDATINTTGCNIDGVITTNNSLSKLNISGGTILGSIYNIGQLVISNATIDYKENSNYEYLINNSGLLTLNNNIVRFNISDDYMTYNDIIRNSGTLTSSSNNYKSLYTTPNSTRARTIIGIYNELLFTSQSDKFTLNNSNYAYTIYNNSNSESSISNIISNIDNSDYAYNIYNNGNITLNSGDFTINNSTNTYGMYNNSGTMNLNDGNILVTNSENIYGLYLKDGIINLKLGSYQLNGTNNVYGIKMDKGEFNLGTYDGSGTESSDVSISNPHIEAISTNVNSGIGLYKNRGTFNFYDGYVIASKAPKDDRFATSNTELNYQLVTKYDSTTGYNYCILEYIN